MAYCEITPACVCAQEDNSAWCVVNLVLTVISLAELAWLVLSFGNNKQLNRESGCIGGMGLLSRLLNFCELLFPTLVFLEVCVSV